MTVQNWDTGEDEDTANAIGINPWKYKVIAAFISCGMIAVCGVFYANYYRFIDPEIMIQAQSVEYMLPALIGGLGSVTGPLLGAVIITPISQLLNANLSSIAAGFDRVCCDSDSRDSVSAERHHGLVQ